MSLENNHNWEDISRLSAQELVLFTGDAELHTSDGKYLKGRFQNGIPHGYFHVDFTPSIRFLGHVEQNEIQEGVIFSFFKAGGRLRIHNTLVFDKEELRYRNKVDASKFDLESLWLGYDRVLENLILTPLLPVELIKAIESARRGNR